MNKELLYNADQMKAFINDLADQVIATHRKNIEQQQLVLIGIYTRGVTLAQRLHKIIQEKTGQQLDIGSLGITLYRDDVNHRSSPTMIKPTEIVFSIDDRPMLLIDDVLYTGRTTRAALNEIMDFGRPSLCQLLVLINRSGRQLPIQADYFGVHIEAKNNEKVMVRFHENDPETEDRIELK